MFEAVVFKWTLWNVSCPMTCSFQNEQQQNKKLSPREEGFRNWEKGTTLDSSPLFSSGCYRMPNTHYLSSVHLIRTAFVNVKSPWLFCQ